MSSSSSPDPDSPPAVSAPDPVQKHKDAKARLSPHLLDQGLFPVQLALLGCVPGHRKVSEFHVDRLAHGFMSGALNAEDHPCAVTVRPLEAGVTTIAQARSRLLALYAANADAIEARDWTWLESAFKVRHFRTGFLAQEIGFLLILA